MMHSDWMPAPTMPIYSPEWPQPERGTIPAVPVLLGYWHNAQFVVDLATGDVWYRVQHDPIWMHYSSVATWLQTRAGRDYLRAMEKVDLSATARQPLCTSPDS